MPASQAERQDFAADHARPRIDDLQILRAVAIACVLVEHSWFNLLFHQSWLAPFLNRFPLWCGVDLFFVISGFVITRGLLPDVLAAPRGGPVLARFYVRRVFRLWPAAWLWLALIFIGSFIFVHPPVLGTPSLNWQGALAGALGFANFRLASMQFHLYGASYPYWSLSLEEQFYVLLPPLLLLARHRAGWVAAVLILVQLPLPHPHLYFFLRNDGLLWGVLLAATPAASRAAHRAAASLSRAAWAGPLVLAAAILLMTQLSPPFERSPPFLLGALAFVGAIPVWLAGANRNLFTFGLAQKPLLWLGNRSYALYLCHMPIYRSVAEVVRTTAHHAPFLQAHADLMAASLAIPMLAVCAELTNKLVERPVRRIGVRLTASFGHGSAGLNALEQRE